MLLFAGYFQHGVTHGTARIERIRFLVRCFRRQYLFYSIGKSSGCRSVRNHVTGQTLPIQSIRYVETFNVVHRVFQNEQFGRNDVIISGAKMTVVPNHR